MSISKFILNGVTQVDVTDTTATAADVALGKFFYDAAGIKTAGTGGGSWFGTDYEQGIFTPSTDIMNPTISFAKTHTSAPAFVMMIDTNNTSANAGSNVGFVFFDSYKIYGTKIPYSGATTKYALILYTYISGSTSTYGGYATEYSYENPESSSADYTRYWATESGFFAYTRSTVRFWRSGRTYKWIAIWI